MQGSAGEEFRVAFRIIKTIVGITFCVLFASNATGQARIGDWEFRAESEESAGNDRIAFSFDRGYSDSKPKPRLVIRQTKPGKPVKLLIFDTHNKEIDSCVYKDWKVMIDSASIPVLGYTFEEAKTELKANWSAPRDELWNLFKGGLRLEVQVEQKCDSFAGESKLASYTFSLRGSRAAYKFVLADPE